MQADRRLERIRNLFLNVVQSVKKILTKMVMHSGLKAEEMRTAGCEVASALNQRPGPTGVSPGMMLFGQRLKLYGELYADGRPASHPDGAGQSTELGRRFHIRNIARQAVEQYHAKELVRRTVAARTRKVEKYSNW